MKKFEIYHYKKNLAAKVIITKHNLYALRSIIREIKRRKIDYIKLILPLPVDKKTFNEIPSLREVVCHISEAKKYASESKLKIIPDRDLECNPLLPKNKDFFDESSLCKKFIKKLYKVKPKVSIIVPLHNKKKEIGFVLKSLFSQDFPKDKYEVIIVDDGSTDNGYSVASKIKPACNFGYYYWPRKKIRLSSNLQNFTKCFHRLSSVRNIGVSLALGDIVMFNDADIILPKNVLRKHYAYHKKSKNIVVRGFRMYLPQSFKLAAWNGKYQELKRVSIPELSLRKIRNNCRLHNLFSNGWYRFEPYNLSIRKKYLEHVGGFSKDFVFWGLEDIDMGYRLRELNMRLMWDSSIQVYHLYHERGTSDFDQLFTCWASAHILYRRHLDENIYHLIYKHLIDSFDKLVLARLTKGKIFNPNPAHFIDISP